MYCDKGPQTDRQTDSGSKCCVWILSYLGVALIDGMCDSLHKVVSHASLGVTVSLLRLSCVAGLVTAGGLDEAQQGAAHQEQHQTGGRAAGDRGLHD